MKRKILSAIITLVVTLTIIPLTTERSFANDAPQAMAKL